MGMREVAATDVAPGGVRPPIDVVIVVALEDELDAVIAEGGGSTAWQEMRDRDGLAYRVSAVPNREGKPLGIAAAWTGAMGTTATAARAASLIRDLQPSCVAMCGICAGKRGDVSLGDVIVADRIYSFDHGKLVAARDGLPGAFCHDITMYNLERAWQMDAAAFRRDLGWAADLLPRRPPQKEIQRRWLLHALHAHEHEGRPAPVTHPERAAVFRIDAAGRASSDWADRIRELREQKLVELMAGALKLTELGRQAIDEDRVLYPEGLPREPPFEVHVGPIATGNAVIEDPQIFDRLKRIGRKTLGVEMEALAIGYVGDALPRRAIVAKAVSDHADHDKDDRFRDFACRASAAWLLAFLKSHLVPKRAVRTPAVLGTDDAGPCSPFADLAADRDRLALNVASDDERLGLPAALAELRSMMRWTVGDDDAYRLNDLYRRAHRALGLRLPDAALTWKRGPDDAPFALRSFLEVRKPGGGYTRAYPVAVIDGPVDRPTLDRFVDTIVTPYRADTPYLEAGLIHTGAASSDVIDEARQRGVRLDSLLELQGLLDFRPCVGEQTRRLEHDTVYPSHLYVPQRLVYGLGRDERTADDALDALDRLLGEDGPRLLLVLGDFGTGKTFLMHELALRLGRRDGATVPILIELRKLEKARSLDALLGQHFIPERGMKRFDYDAFRYMLEEGRIALLFDGFDELALRVTYETATEHLDTVLQAAAGKAKVVITSRTQHFINDQQVVRALGERIRQRGFRMARLLPFDESRIRQFLFNRFDDDVVARGWFELLGEVKDLLGLSHNPRMLSFIADIPEQDLRRAAAGGEITSATLYRVLLEKWLGHEVTRDHPAGIEPGLPAASRWKAVTELALLLWPRKERTIAVGEIPPAILDEVARLAERSPGADAVAHKLGSGTLLSRDEDGRFSFIHQSIVEWLVANTAAEDVRSGRDCAALAAGEVSDLMADFLGALAGRDAVVAWARRSMSTPSSDIATTNANRLLRRLHDATDDRVPTPEQAAVDVAFEMSGQDLRGQDFSGTNYLRGASLEDINLSEASLVAADLAGARLTRAQLQGANLEGASLRGADLQGADLSFARLLGADLAQTRLAGAKLRYAKLVGAELDRDALRDADTFGAAHARPQRFDLALGLPVATCSSIAWSPDGAILALGYRDGSVVVAEAATGRSLRLLESHRYGVTGTAFSPDGTLLASAADDPMVRLWNPETGALVHSLEHVARVTGIAFSPDGQCLASVSDDRTIHLWNPATGTLVRSLESQFASVSSVAFSPDGELLASGADQSIELWNARTGARVHRLLGHLGQVTAVAFSHDSVLLASGSVDRTVLWWNCATGVLAHAPLRHGNTVTSLAFSRDGKHLASGCKDGQIRMWHPATGALLRALGHQTPRVTCVAFSPDGKQLASGGGDMVIRLWNPETGKLLRSLEGGSDWVNAVAFSPDGKLVASGSRDQIVRVWDPRTGQRQQLPATHAAWVNSVAFSPDGRLLASASNDHTVLMSNVKTHAWALLEGHSGAVNSVAFSPDSKLVASGSNDRSVLVWRIADRLENLPDARTTSRRVASRRVAPQPSAVALAHQLSGHSARVNRIAFSPTAHLLASGSDDNTVWLWNTVTGLPMRTLRGHSAWVNSVAFSPDGASLASGSEDGTIRLWDPETGGLRRSLEGHTASVSDIAFSADHKLLASSSFKTIKLWQPATGALLCTLDAHTHWINAIAFSPDGKLLATGSSDYTIRLWSVSAALHDDDREPCVAIMVPVRGGGWMAIAPDGRYKLGGGTGNAVGFSVGLCRFEPGELDAYAGAFAHPRRIPDDEPLFALDEPLLAFNAH